MQAVIPKYAPSNEGKNGKPQTTKASDGDHHNNCLMEHLHNGIWKHHKLVACQTRPPKYHEGQYRLSFSGRVLFPSVKNMQLENEQGELLMQFGKVDDETFHLDYKVSAASFFLYCPSLFSILILSFRLASGTIHRFQCLWGSSLPI